MFHGLWVFFLIGILCNFLQICILQWQIMLRMNCAGYGFSRLIFLTNTGTRCFINKFSLILNRLNVSYFMRRSVQIFCLFVSILLSNRLWNLMLAAVTRFSCWMWSYKMQLFRSLDIYLYAVNSRNKKDDTWFKVFPFIFLIVIDFYL